MSTWLTYRFKKENIFLFVLARALKSRREYGYIKGIVLCYLHRHNEYFCEKKNQEQNKSWQDGWIKKPTPDFLSNTMSWDSKQTFRPKIKSQRSSSYGGKIIYILYYIGRRKWNWEKSDGRSLQRSSIILTMMEDLSSSILFGEFGR